MAHSRSGSGRFAPADVDSLFDDIGLPRPSKIHNVFASLEKAHLLSRAKGKGPVWKLTPTGRARSEQLFSDIDLSALIAQAAAAGGTNLGSTVHPVIPPSLAPPELIGPLQTFLADHPFDLNVFGMTRFPDEQEKEESLDPVGQALDVAREVCRLHGLEFHLASDRAISDDLWANVTGHIWASRYGIAFFEDRRGRGLNYNLTIEVGSMLMTGRRCALLKDSSIEKLPTDLVGKIYKPIDLERADSVTKVLHAWIRDDLRLGSCKSCES